MNLDIFHNNDMPCTKFRGPYKFLCLIKLSGAWLNRKNLLKKNTIIENL